MGKIYTSAEQLIGGTPLLELTHLERELGLSARILGKLESFNPGGSAVARHAKRYYFVSQKVAVKSLGPYG